MYTLVVIFLLLILLGDFYRKQQKKNREKRREKEGWAEETMIDQVKEMLSRLKEKYPITDTWSGEKGEFKVSGIDDTFYVDFLSRDHCTLHNNHSWHEHFIEWGGEPYGRGGHYSLEDFLDGLFTGFIQIRVKYRGNTPVGHEVGFVGEGGFEGIRHTSILRLKSFFKSAWFKKLEYKLDNKQLEGTRH